IVKKEVADLDKLRQNLDQVDEELINLVAKRMDVVRELIKIKSRKSDGIKDSERERAVMQHIEKVARDHNISAPFARKLFREIMNYSLSEQARHIGGEKSEHLARVV